MSSANPVTSSPRQAGDSRCGCDWVVAWIRPEELVSAELGGWISMAATSRGLCRLVLPQPSVQGAIGQLDMAASWSMQWTPILCRAYRQLRAYLSGRLGRLTVSVDLDGVSTFQQAVLRASCAIPPGQTATYGQLAQAVGRPGAARAVGGAMAANPMPLVVPCHRVVAADGTPGGFSAGVERKQALLELEQMATGAGSKQRRR